MAITSLNRNRVVGYVVVGNGTTTKSTYFSDVHKGRANRLKRAWIARFSYTAPVITVLADGTMASTAADASSIATAKTYLQGLSKRSLQRMQITADRRKLIQGALP